MAFGFPELSLETWINILSAIGVASGWVAFLFERLSERPKIRGKVLFYGGGTVSGVKDGKLQDFVATIIGLYLTNHRKSGVHIIDYEVEIGFGKHRFLKRFHDFGRPWYGIQPNWNIGFRDTQGKMIDFQDFNKMLIYRQNKPVQFGSPLTGYMVLLSDISFQKKLGDEAHWARIRVIDALGHKHKIISSLERKNLPELDYLGEMYGLRVSPVPSPTGGQAS